MSSAHFSQHVYYRILPPLIPVLAVALDYPLWQLGLLITVYSLGKGAVEAPLGVLSDRVDRVYLLPVGITLTGAAYIFFAFAPVLGGAVPTLVLLEYTFEGGYLLMIVAMIVVGFGVAVVHPTGYPMITDNVSDDNKGKVLGIWGASSRVGDGVTPAVIAGLILLLTWDQIILFFGVTGFLYGIVLFGVLRSDDYVTVPTGQRDETDADSDDQVLRDDRRSYLYPLLAIYVFFISTSLTKRGLTTFFPAFMIAVYAYSFEVMGVQIGPESAANLYFSLLLFAGAGIQLYLGNLVDSYDPRLVLLVCMAFATLGMIALAVVQLTPLVLFGVIVLIGIGLYGINPPRDALVSDVSPPEREGRTFGYLFTASALTGAAFPTIIGYILETVGMREGYLALAAGTILGAISILLLYSNRVYVEEDRERSVASD